jgi:hypothetical protein
VRWKSWLGTVPVLVFALLVVFTGGTPAADFTDITPGLLADHAGDGVAVTWADIDVDGDDDLLLINSSTPDRLFRSDGGGTYTELAVPALQAPGFTQGAAWADYDNDGDEDVHIITYQGPNRLLRNDGGALVEVTPSVLADSTGRAGEPSWADFDNDGLVDLHVTRGGSSARMYRNEGGGAFSTVTNPITGAPGGGLGEWADYDLDGDLDLFEGVRNGNDRLYRNDGPGSFVDVTLPPMDAHTSCNGPIWLDADNDLDFDALLGMVGGQQQPNRLYRNDGTSVFALKQDSTLGYRYINSMSAADYDNDGDMDMFHCFSDSCGGSGNALLRNDGGEFVVDPTPALGGHGASRAAAWSDIDDDGDLDLYICEDGGCGGNSLIRNDNANGNHWLKVRLEGVASNRSAIGARVEVHTEAGSQLRDLRGGGYFSQDSRTVHFGLGAEVNVDLLTVFWPSGAVDSFRDVAADQTLLIVEGAGDATAVAAPASVSLEVRVAPNPFEGGTSVYLRLPRESAVDVGVYDVAGRRVRPLERGRLPAGTRVLYWDGTRASGEEAAPGVYYVRVRTPLGQQVQRAVRVR